MGELSEGVREGERERMIALIEGGSGAGTGRTEGSYACGKNM